MTFKITLHSDRQIREHVLTVGSRLDQLGQAGNTDFSLDGEANRLDWAVLAPGRYSVLASGKSYQVRLRKPATPMDRSGSYVVSVGNRSFGLDLEDVRNRRHESVSTGHHGAQEVLAPMPGKVIRILSTEGSSIAPGQGLLVIEAMKMQNEIRAPRAGHVEKIYVREGEGVEAGSPLLRLA
jgi:biotin carboxyl carrier protein